MWQCVSQTVKNKSVLVFWFVRNLMHTNFSVTFLIALCAISGLVPRYSAEEWIDCALWLIRCKREIPLWSSAVVTCQQFGRHIWTGVQISMSNFRHCSYNSLSWMKFSGPQENQDLPSFHWKSRQLLSALTPFNMEGLSCMAAKNLPTSTTWLLKNLLQSREKWNLISNIYIYIYIYIYIDLVSVCCRLWLFVIVFTSTFSFLLLLLLPWIVLDD